MRRHKSDDKEVLQVQLHCHLATNPIFLKLLGAPEEGFTKICCRVVCRLSFKFSKSPTTVGSCGGSGHGAL